MFHRMIDLYTASLASKDEEIAQLQARVQELENILGRLADLPSHGMHGGPLTCIAALYEDGTKPDHSILGHEVVEKLKAAMQKEAK